MKKLLQFIKQNSDISLILVVASIVRLGSILKDDMWYDEAFTGLMMRAPRALLIDIIHTDPHPPLYTLLSKLWCLVFGVNDLTLRLLPFVFGIATIALTYVLITKLFNKETAIISAFLLAISPFFIDYSIEARSYSFYAFLTVLALYMLLKEKYVRFIVCLIALFYTHYISVVYMPMLILIYIVKIRKAKYPIKKVLGQALLFAIPFLILFFYGFMGSRVHQDDRWAGESSLFNIVKSVASYTYGVKTKLGGASVVNDFNTFISKDVLVYGLFFIYLMGLSIALVKTYRQKNRQELTNILIILGLTFVPQLTLIIGSKISNEAFYVERYLIPSSVFFLISAAFILKKVMKFEYIVLLVCIYCILISQIRPQIYYSGMRELATHFNKYQGELVFTSPVDYTVGLYYLPEAKVKLYDPKNSNETFWWWWFVTPESRPTWAEDTLLITPDDERVTNEFSQVPNSTYGNYKVYMKVN